MIYRCLRVWVLATMNRVVCVETNELGYAIRIFRTEKAAAESGLLYIFMNRKSAVGQIREQVRQRAKDECQWCSKPLNMNSMHMHEEIHRGQGGEISLANCVCICYSCHYGPAGHGDRDTRFGEIDAPIL